MVTEILVTSSLRTKKDPQALNRSELDFPPMAIYFSGSRNDS